MAVGLVLAGACGLAGRWVRAASPALLLVGLCSAIGLVLAVAASPIPAVWVSAPVLAAALLAGVRLGRAMRPNARAMLITLAVLSLLDVVLSASTPGPAPWAEAGWRST